MPIINKKFEKCFIFFAAFFALFFWFGVDANAHESTTENSVVIHVDEKGFEPRILTIRVGTEVIFENVGKEEHWPASDDHPSHTLYDGTSMEEHCARDITVFDSCRAIGPDEIWSFVFEKEGVFDYHDHLSSHLGGTIVVEKSEKGVFGRFVEIVKKFFERFRRDVGKKAPITLNSGEAGNKFYLDLKERYKNITTNQDPLTAIHTLEEESAKDERVYALCHDVLHEIGKTSYAKYKSFSEAVKFQNDFCNSGYLHGIFEAYFGASTNPSEGLREQCGEYASKTGRAFDLWQCYHGAGHGFMYFTAGDLDRSLALCEESFGKELGVHCQNGAFMEVFNLEVLAKERDFVNINNPLSLCSERKSKQECYPYAAVYFHHTKKMPFSDIFEECDKAEFGYKNLCVFGIGSEAIKRNMNRPDSVISMCLGARSESYKKECLSGAARMYVMNSGGLVSEGRKLCASVPEQYREPCGESLDNLDLFFEQVLHFEKI